VANLIVSAVSTFDNKGLKKGKKELTAFEQTVNKLGKTFASVFAARKLLAFSRNAVNAFMADEKAAKSLQIQLQNTGNAFAIPSVEYYIANLQKVTGVLDDQLRPAFQQLLTVTGSITKSQDALNTALNVSAATGRSLTEVSAALTRGFSGNTAGLSRLGAGISKATLKTGDMDKILGELNNKFAGQAQARLTTYAGKMDLLTVSAENFKEEIGKGILDALSALGKDKSIENATTQMDNFGKSIGDAIYGTGLLIAKLNGLVSKAGGGGLTDLLLRLQPGGMQASRAFNFLSSTGANERNKSSSNFTYSLGSSATRDIERAKEVLRLRASNKLRQDEINKMKAKTEVDKLSEKFDVERIGLMKALAEATDAETKLRIQAKLAILDNNEALAKKYNAELAASSAAKTLADSANNAANALNTLPSKYDQIFTSLVGQFKSMGIEAGAAAGLAASSARLQAQADAFFAQAGQYAVPGGMPSSATTAAAAAAPTVVPQVTVNTGAVLTNQQDLTVYIQNALGEITKLGNGSLIPAGSIAFQ
jgi:hypothetical protein